MRRERGICRIHLLILLGLFLVACSTERALESRPEVSPWYTLSGAVPQRVIPDSTADVSSYSSEELNAVIAHGRYITENVAACGRCHGPDLSGGRKLVDDDGEVFVPNITPDEASGIGTWSISEIAQAIRASIGKEQSALSIELHRGYRWMSDVDTRAIALYLLSVPAVTKKVQRRELGLLARKRMGIISRRVPVEGYVPALGSNTAVVQHGRYLVKHVANCGGCHTAEDGIFSDAEYLSGDDQVPNVRGSEGLKDWDVKKIASYLASGTESVECPLPYYKGMKLKDRQAIAKFLKTL